MAFPCPPFELKKDCIKLSSILITEVFAGPLHGVSTVNASLQPRPCLSIAQGALLLVLPSRLSSRRRSLISYLPVCLFIPLCRTGQDKDKTSVILLIASCCLHEIGKEDPCQEGCLGDLQIVRHPEERREDPAASGIGALPPAQGEKQNGERRRPLLDLISHLPSHPWRPLGRFTVLLWVQVFIRLYVLTQMLCFFSFCFSSP